MFEFLSSFSGTKFLEINDIKKGIKLMQDLNPKLIGSTKKDIPLKIDK